MRQSRALSKYQRRQGAVRSRDPAAMPRIHLGVVGRNSRAAFLGRDSGGSWLSRARWLLSTALAGAVGSCLIGVVVYSSLDVKPSGGMRAAFAEVGRSAAAALDLSRRRAQGFRVARQKADQLKLALRGLSAKYIIDESITQKRGNREFIAIRKFARLKVQLSSGDSGESARIPPLNPFRLYATRAVSSARKAGAHGKSGEVVGQAREIKELPVEDGMELDEAFVRRLVSEIIAEDSPKGALDVASVGEGGEGDTDAGGAAAGRATASLVAPALTTIFPKTVVASAGGEGDEREVRVFRVGAGDTMERILVRAGAADWQAKAIVAEARRVLGKRKIRPGYQIRMTLVPSPTQPGASEPVQVSVFMAGQRHLVSVARNEAGDYQASRSPLQGGLLAAALAGADKPKRASLYTSLYKAGLGQHMTAQQILQTLRIHAYDTDYKRLVSPGDAMEAVFDLPDGTTGTNGRLGSLLFTSLTVTGRTRAYYRFRTPDGQVDYYDSRGRNAKKFLMRKPVRSRDVRLTSGYGMRMHPLLRVAKMHRGVDWAARAGTPIMAGGNGTIEFAGRRSSFGNYVRIRHANGYKTAYAHMKRIAKGIREGGKVRIGQVIGYIGTTGRSSGPHLHYEVLVNGRHVDPMRIAVPRGRQLKGRLLAEFQKQRLWIDDLRRRRPVATRIARAGE